MPGILAVVTRRRLDPLPAARDALELLGAQTRIERQARRLSRAELAVRAGVSERTVAAVELASPNVTAGNLMSVAAAAGVDLFGAGSPEMLTALRNQAEQTVALLPSRARRKPTRDNDGLDF